MKKARLIITFSCPRDCEYCCNKQEKNLAALQPLTDLSKLNQYEEIMLTGGEPCYNPKQTIALIHKIRKINPTAKVYLYTAWNRNDAAIKLIPYVDGLHYTIHAHSTVQDVKDFHSLQDYIFSFESPDYVREGITYRLYIVPMNYFEIKLMPFLWHRVEIKPWLENCPLPEDDLFYIPSYFTGECDDG